MARPKTPKQLQISINSLKKKIAELEARKKRALAAIKKKAAKKKPTKKKVAKRKPAKKKAVKKKSSRKPTKRKVVKKKKRR